MSLTKASKIISKNPNISKKALDKLLGYPLPDLMFKIAKQHGSKPSTTLVNKKLVATDNLPNLKVRGRKPHRREECTKILMDNPDLSIPEVEAIMNRRVPQSCYIRAQLSIGGVTDYQKSIFSCIVSTANSMVQEGLDPFSMSPRDIKRLTGRVISTDHIPLVLRSNLFLKEFQPYLTSAKRSVKHRTAVASEILRMHLDGSPEDYDVRMVKSGTHLVLEVSRKV